MATSFLSGTGENIAISIPGLLFLVYLVDLLSRLKLPLPLSPGLRLLLSENSSLATLLFIVIGLAIGSYIFLYGLRIYSNFFEKIFSEGMSDRDPGHNFWRQFSISSSFAILLMLVLEMIYLLLSTLSLVGLLLIAFLITSIEAYRLHKDIALKNKECNKDTWKSFSWDMKGIQLGYFSPEGIKAIAHDQDKWIQELSKKEKIALNKV